SSINDEWRTGRAAGPGDGGGVRVVVPGAGGRDPGADRVAAGPAGRADDGRGDHRGAGGRPVHGVGAPEGPGRGPVRAGRAARYGSVLPGQRGVRGVLPVGRRHRDGPHRPGGPVLLTRETRRYPVPEDIEQARSTVVARYSRLARAAAGGGEATDGEGCFGAAAYGEAAGLPEAALRASLGCGNPVAVDELEPGETVLDLGSG